MPVISGGKFVVLGGASQVGATIAEQLLAGGAREVVLLDNLELLFDVRLQQNPLRCLQALARHRTIVATWNGAVLGAGSPVATLTYAVPNHPEYRREPLGDTLLVLSRTDGLFPA